MFLVIFEVQPRADRWSDYLETARLLRPELERIDGFVDNERYRSESVEGRVLSLSSWRDEKALIRWRTQASHHREGQERGRTEIFADYHLRVGEVATDSALPDGAVLQGQRFDVTEVGAAPVVTVTEVTPPASLDSWPADLPGLIAYEWFASLTHAGKRVLLASWTDAESASRFSPAGIVGVRHRQGRVIRDYGMRDRREAPQYFPDVV